MKIQRTPKTASTSIERKAEREEIRARRMRTNADHVNFVYDQVHAHRVAAAASVLPRVRANLLALANSLEAQLDPGERPPAVANGDEAAKVASP